MCVDSVLNQTYQNLEVILVDDGSPDDCPAICDDYAKKDKRIRVIHQHVCLAPIHHAHRLIRQRRGYFRQIFRWCRLHVIPDSDFRAVRLARRQQARHKGNDAGYSR